MPRFAKEANRLGAGEDKHIMKIYVTRINGLSLKNPLQYRQSMVLDIARQLGCVEMGIYCYPAENEEAGRRSSRLDGIIAGINAGDLVILQLPIGNGIRFERELVNHIKVYGARVAVYLHDMEALVCESNRHVLCEAVNLYNLAEVLVLPSYEMKQFLMDNDIRKSMKFVVQEMWDYIANDRFLHIPSFRKEIQFTDNAGFEGMTSWKYRIPLKLYGVSTGQSENICNTGRDPDEAFYELSEGGFGLVWYQDVEHLRYMAYSISFSLGRYLASGIPVIVPVGISNQRVIEENHLGLVVNSLEEAVRKIETMDEAEYQGYVRNVAEFATALRAGYYTKRCLIDTMQAFYRKDVGKAYIPSRECLLGKCTFSTSVLRESYGGGLALLWEFQGKADGFLVYDVSGRLVCETRNAFQHYLWIEGYRKETGFIVKAYIETLKCKLIVAESSPVYLYTSQYKKPEISLIIPAYNAEDYVARSIDTALVQSFSNLEIIIVDDGSTDHTPDIIDWYAQKYPNVWAIHQENGGVPAARNTGIKNANGDYIAFMDNDDMLRPDMISRLYHSICANDCDIACTSVYEIHKDEYKETMQYPMKEDTAVTIKEFLQMHLDRKAIWAVCVWNKLYRASLVKDHPFPIIISDDEAWTPYILSYANRICYLNTLSYEYDRIIRRSTLADQWIKRSKDEMFKMHMKTVLFYLGNSNPKMIYLLKEFA